MDSTLVADSSSHLTSVAAIHFALAVDFFPQLTGIVAPSKAEGPHVVCAS
jgi:hypothetical protein